MSENETINIEIPEDMEGHRLDKALAKLVDEMSRSRIQALLKEENVLLNGKVINNASGKVHAGELYIVNVPEATPAIPEPQDIPLDIIYEDDQLLVINKSAGLVVHPAAGNWDGTLVNALLAHCGDQLSGIGGVKRPGIVHRLDKDTSGLMIVAKTDKAHKSLSEQLSERKLKRVYQAIVWGVLPLKEGKVAGNIGRSRTNRKKMALLEHGGKEAVTHYKVLKQFGLLASLVECRLETGRTHQIRVHMSSQQHWLIGDPVYRRPTQQRFMKPFKVKEEVQNSILSFPRQALYAAEICFLHPTKNEEMSFKLDIPDDMKNLLSILDE